MPVQLPQHLLSWRFAVDSLEDHVPFRHGRAPLNSCDRPGVPSQTPVRIAATAMLGEVPRRRLRSEFVRGVAAERYRLAQVVYGQCPLVERPSRCWLFHRCHLDLAFTIVVVALRLRPSRSSLEDPSFCAFDRSRERGVGIWLGEHNGPRTARAVCGAAGWGFSAGDAPRRWKRASPIRGDDAIPLRGVINSPHDMKGRFVTITVAGRSAARANQISYCCDGSLPPRRRFGSKDPQRRSGDAWR
jgi:hypothetical protein